MAGDLWFTVFPLWVVGGWVTEGLEPTPPPWMAKVWASHYPLCYDFFMSLAASWEGGHVGGFWASGLCLLFSPLTR